MLIVVVIGDDAGRDRVGALQLAEVAGVLGRDHINRPERLDCPVGDVADVADRDGDEVERPDSVTGCCWYAQIDTLFVIA